MANTDIKVVLSATDKTQAAFASAKRNLSDIDAQAGKLKSAFASLGLTLGAGLAVRSIIEAADSFKNLQARLKLASRDMQEFSSANADLVRIAFTARAPLAEMATLYTRIAASVKDLNVTQEQIAATTEAVALSLRISGASAQESSSAMLQFSQAVASGVLRGEEFNAVSEAAPRLLQALANSLGKPVGQLREMAKEGQLTRDVLINGLLAELPKLRAEAASLPDTIGTAFTNLRNKLLLTVGAFDDATKATGGLGAAINTIGTAGIEALAVVGANVAFVFEGIGREIGGIAAQLAALAKLDFTQFRLIGDAIKEDAKAARAELDALEKRLLSIGQAKSGAAPAPGAGGGALNALGAALSGKGGAGRAKTDPLASFFKATDTARLKEYNTLTAELLRRMANAKGDTTIYVQALDEINQKFADVIGMAGEMQDALGTGSFFATDPETIKFIQEQQDAINELNAIVPEAEQRFQSMLAAADFTKLKQDQEDMIILADKFNAGLLTEAEYLDLVKNRLGLIGGETDKTTDLFEELGNTITAAAAGIGGAAKNADDFLRDLGVSIAKVIAQVLILEPLIKSLKDAMGSTSGGTSSGGGLGSLVSSAASGFGDWLGSLFAFEQGGVMGPMGPLPLRKYAYGGVANSPQLAMFGEGSTPEAYVPLPDGRRIPVAMQGGGGQVVNNITIRADNPASVRASRGQLLADIQNELRRAQRNT